MKKITQPANKLQFKKQAIANLSRTEQSNVNGGKAAVTTSFGNCTGFLCCSPSKSREIIDDLLDTILGPGAGNTGNNNTGNNNGIQP